MRWKLSLAAPVLSLLFLATSCNAQPTRQDTIPLTVTIPASTEHHPVIGVGFVGVVPDTVIMYEPTDVRTQYLVGDVGPFDGRYRFISRVRVGARIFEDTLYVQEKATCDNSDETEGKIERIACSVVEKGVGLVCSATYSGMKDPPMICEGTIACTKCGQVRVCGSGPGC